MTYLSSRLKLVSTGAAEAPKNVGGLLGALGFGHKSLFRPKVEELPPENLQKSSNTVHNVVPASSNLSPVVSLPSFRNNAAQSSLDTTSLGGSVAGSVSPYHLIDTSISKDKSLNDSSARTPLTSIVEGKGDGQSSKAPTNKTSVANSLASDHKVKNQGEISTSQGSDMKNQTREGQKGKGKVPTNKNKMKDQLKNVDSADDGVCQYIDADDGVATRSSSRPQTANSSRPHTAPDSVGNSSQRMLSKELAGKGTQNPGTSPKKERPNLKGSRVSSATSRGPDKEEADANRITDTAASAADGQVNPKFTCFNGTKYMPDANAPARTHKVQRFQRLRCFQRLKNGRAPSPKAWQAQAHRGCSSRYEDERTHMYHYEHAMCTVV